MQGAVKVVGCIRVVSEDENLPLVTDVLSADPFVLRFAVDRSEFFDEGLDLRVTISMDSSDPGVERLQ